ncbi:glycoside hydrolase 100 family protein [Gloeobacter kilaueensis]|uniref:beta-fructofuranosidase n=1 Tax=Gloeobacter kilaueensis (strain ATCC BAA-2537 / CCAP 1431/1 / ULC 316 / JS1) TaxID=1183438 RepID=U5QK56_GLOK1|nr:glycoside hydrolase 100 family protein [Gloeobacter kilaueensis]AGY59278.1 beta-fructofuranosidase [Gloeobacter kilaueensis JS1]
MSEKTDTAFERSVVQSARELLYEGALAVVDGAFAGALAAIPQAKGDQKTVVHDLNYTEVFIRDNVPVMVYLLIEGKGAIVRHFLETCLKLQSTHQQTSGIFPTSFFESEGRLVADYGQRAIGRVTSVDATLWWPILAHTYVQRTKDRQWASEPHVQAGLQRFLRLVLQPGFRDAPTLLVPDGAFMVDRPLDVWGIPLEVQTLLYGALVSAAELIRVDLEAKGLLEGGHPAVHHAEKAFISEQRQQLQQAIRWAHRLRHYLLKYYWVNTSSIQVLRRRPTEQYGDQIANEYNIQTETIPHWLQLWLGPKGGYLIGNIRTGRPDFRFFTLGNCLGAIFDILSSAQQQSLFQLVVHNQTELVAEMPLRICHPPLDSEKWRSVTGFDPKNRPWCYHNGGHWPCLLWYLALAILRHPSKSTARLKPALQLLEQTYQDLLYRLPKQKWAEYFDGPTGLWTGQQARYYQTWTIVGFLLVHHLLRVEAADAHIFDLPRLKHLRPLMN